MPASLFVTPAKALLDDATSEYAAKNAALFRLLHLLNRLELTQAAWRAALELPAEIIERVHHIIAAQAARADFDEDTVLTLQTGAAGRQTVAVHFAPDMKVDGVVVDDIAMVQLAHINTFYRLASQFDGGIIGKRNRRGLFTAIGTTS